MTRSVALKQFTQRGCGISIPGCFQTPETKPWLTSLMLATLLAEGKAGQDDPQWFLPAGTSGICILHWLNCSKIYIESVCTSRIWSPKDSPYKQAWHTQLTFYKGGFVWGTKLRFVADTFQQSMFLPLTLYPLAGVYTFQLFLEFTIWSTTQNLMKQEPAVKMEKESWEVSKQISPVGCMSSLGASTPVGGVCWSNLV